MDKRRERVSADHHGGIGTYLAEDSPRCKDCVGCKATAVGEQARCLVVYEKIGLSARAGDGIAKASIFVINGAIRSRMVTHIHVVKDAEDALTRLYWTHGVDRIMASLSAKMNLQGSRPVI
jgi:hypothetical protein